MSLTHVIFGWLDDILIQEIHEQLANCFDVSVRHANDIADRANLEFTIHDDYPQKNAFNKTCTLTVYNRPYVQIDLNGDNLQLTPFTLVFEMFLNSYNQTSIPMLERVIQVFDVIKPIFSISGELGTIMTAANLREDGEWEGEFLSPNDLHVYVSGFFSISSKIAASQLMIDNTNLYKTLDYSNGRLTISPSGISVANEFSGFYTDLRGRTYFDEFLRDIISQNYRIHMNESHRILKELKFSIHAI